MDNLVISGSVGSIPTSGTSLKLAENKQNASKSKTATTKTRSNHNTNKGRTIYRHPDDYHTPYLGDDFAKVPVGDGMYTFHRDHLPKADLVLGHPYQLSVQEQLTNYSFLADWRYYEEVNEKASKAYLVREYEIEKYERQIAEGEAA